MDEKLKAKVDEEVAMTGAIRPEPAYCRSCMWAHSEQPFADGPDKANCRKYMDTLKPWDVLFDGAPCDFYIKEMV